LSEGTVKTLTNFGQDIHCPGQISSRAPSDSNLGPLPLHKRSRLHPVFEDITYKILGTRANIL